MLDSWVPEDANIKSPEGQESNLKVTESATRLDLDHDCSTHKAKKTGKG